MTTPTELPDGRLGMTIEQVRVRITPDRRMTRRDTARYLGVAEKTLAMWHLDGKGPASVKIGGRRFYFLDVVDQYIADAAAAS